MPIRRRKRFKAVTLAKIKSKIQKRRYSRSYLRLMNAVRARDGWRCALCHAKRKTQIHHIIRHADSVHLRNNKRNLIALCNKCHSQITIGSREARYAPMLKQIVSRNTRWAKDNAKTYDEHLEELKKYQALPDGFESFQYLEADDLKKDKTKEHYLRVTWRSIRYRIFNKNSKSYSRYGGRGIKLHKEWEDFEVFKDYVAKYLGERPDGYSIDRIDNDGNYEPGNIRWASPDVQKQNNSQTKLDPAIVIAIFIAHHKYNIKQNTLMYKMALNNASVVSCIVRFKSWRNILYPYRSVVKNPKVLEAIKEYEKEL